MVSAMIKILAHAAPHGVPVRNRKNKHFVGRNENNLDQELQYLDNFTFGCFVSCTK
jgi:hypothetical protein